MKTNLKSELSSALHRPESLLMCLCCIGFLTACDKETSQESKSETTQRAQKKNAALPAEVKAPTSLHSLTVQLKDQGGDWKTRSDAISLVEQLGREKRVEAVPSLLDAMFLVQPFSINNVTDYADAYPCSASLEKIGEPAVPQIQTRFLATRANMEQMVLLDTLRRIKGSEYVATWLESLPDKGIGSLSGQRRSELKQWALSHTP